MGKAPEKKVPVARVGDSLKITVRNEPEISGHFQVTRAGEIHFPLLGSLSVVGMNTQQVARLLRRGLERDYLVSPHVTVVLLLKPR